MGMKAKPKHLLVSNLKSKPKCWAPWINLYAAQRPEHWRMKVCCLSEEVTEVSDVDHIDEYFNSDYVKDVTEKLQQDKFPKSCRRCEFNADLNIYDDIEGYEFQILKLRHKKRLYKNEDDLKNFVKTQQLGGKQEGRSQRVPLGVREEFKKLSLDDIKEILSTEDDKFVMLDLRPGNLCNLKCRMCNMQSSTEIAKENIELQKDQSFVDKLKKLDEEKEIGITQKLGKMDLLQKLSKNYTSTEEHKEEIYKLFDYANLRRLKLLGGEPSIDPTIISILKQLKDNDFTKNDDFRLQITSNLTNVNKIWIDYFELFNVKLTISMDGAGRTYEYIRTPFKWKALKKNIHKVPENLYKDMSINLVGSNLLFLDIKEWFIELANIHKEVPFYINYILCEEPPYLSLKAIPMKYKQKIRQDIISLKEQYNDNNSMYSLLLSFEMDLDKHIRDDTFDPKYLSQFFLINLKQDELRKQNLFDINYTKEIYNDIN